MPSASVFEREQVETTTFLVAEHAANKNNRSFDVTASVYAFRYDLDEHEKIRDETREQVCDEELTYIAEGIDRHFSTEFNLPHDEEFGLMRFHEGGWRSYLGMLITGERVSREEASKDYRRQFLVEWATKDLEIGYAMENLGEGEVLSWNSRFPEKEYRQYGEKFMYDCGLQPRRRMGFLYRAQKNADGSVKLNTHSVDNSDPDAFAAVEKLLEENPQADIDEQVKAYDRALKKKDGQEYKAGRLRADGEENAYAFLKDNSQYVNFYINEIIRLAESPLSGDELADAKERLTYGFWARIKELLNEQQPVPGLSWDYQKAYILYTDILSREQMDQECRLAYKSASRRGEVLAGCGGAVNRKSFDEMSPDEVFDSIFGMDKKKELSWHGGTVKKGTCVNCHEGPKDVGVKNWCRRCISGHCG